MSTDLPRELSADEMAVLRAMVDHARRLDSPTPVTDADRQRWRAQLPTARAGRRCGCGTCPSVDLTDETGRVRQRERSRVVLSADAPGAMLLLFIDDDELSYLELAPIDEDGSFDAFPDVGDLEF
ncbi:hypothetical protein [Ornithinimicrobium panacihumi]|uniref:hypothetical protein n=1 Tax=Ornithinimicrobium panacihumi TaxID=2008449 RepID=UPI003F8B99CE